jgi:signal transduction histidine kinase
MSASLRNRVAVTLALFGAVVSLTLATIIYLKSHDLEQQLIDDTLNAELDDFVARRQRNPQSVPESTATIRAFVVSPDNPLPVPPKVATLALGQHQLTLNEKVYRAAAREVGQQRFIVLYDTSALQRRERGFVLLLAGSVLLITIIAAFAGRWVASGVIAPVNALVRRVAEQSLESKPPPLADEFPWIEIEQLAADFDSYLQRLHAFIERERLFTGDISHELRTPLTIIAGATELLLSDSTLHERNRACVARIDRAVAEMSEMTAALLALAREQKGTPTTSESGNISTVVAELVERYRALFSNKPVALILEVVREPQLQADRAVLSMVLGNLLRNALSFTNEGQVKVRVDVNAVEVRDTGPGIGSGEVDELFRPYVRGVGGNGAGLGLSLIQRLCAREGWKVTLSNLAEGGAVARLVFYSGSTHAEVELATAGEETA